MDNDHWEKLNLPYLIFTHYLSLAKSTIPCLQSYKLCIGDNPNSKLLHIIVDFSWYEKGSLCSRKLHFTLKREQTITNAHHKAVNIMRKYLNTYYPESMEVKNGR